MVDRTVGDLIRELKPKGYVVALVAFTATAQGEPIRATVSVGKTDLLSDLAKMPKDRRAFFKIEEWNWQAAHGAWYRTRRIVIGSTGQDEIERRFVKYDGTVYPKGVKPEYEGE